MAPISFADFLKRRQQGESVEQITKSSLAGNDKQETEKTDRDKYIEQFSSKSTTQASKDFDQIRRFASTGVNYSGGNTNRGAYNTYEASLNRSGKLTPQQRDNALRKGQDPNYLASRLQEQYALYDMQRRNGALGQHQKITGEKESIESARKHYQDTKQTLADAQTSKKDARQNYADMLIKRDNMRSQYEEMLEDYNQRLQNGETEEDLADYYAAIQDKLNKANVYDQQVTDAYDELKNARSEARTASSENAKARDTFNAYSAKFGENAAKEQAAGTAMQNAYDSAPGRVSTLQIGEYANILQRPDYAAMSQAGESKNNLSGRYDATYDYINDINGQRGITKLNALQGRGGGDLGKYDFMTKDEVGVYNYLYATEGKKSAEQFLKSLDIDLNAQYQGWSSNVVADVADDNAAAGTLFSLGTAVMAPARGITGAAAMAQDMYRTVTGQEIDPNSSLRRLSQNTNAVRESVSDSIRQSAPGKIGGVGSFLYNVGMSAADSAVNMLTAQGVVGALGYAGDAALKAANILSSATMSSEVASMSVAESKEKGYSDAGAMSLGLIRGGIEYLSEKLGGEWVIKKVKENPTSLFNTLIRSMIPEGIEENMSDVGNETVNVISDLLFGTDESWLRTTYNAYKANGSKNPFLDTAISAVIQEVLSFSSGALSSVGNASVQFAGYKSSIKAGADALHASESDVVKIMEKYDIKNPRAVKLIAKLTDSDSVKSFDEAMSAYENAQEVVDEAMRLSGQRNGSFLREAGIGSVENQVDSAWDVLTGKVTPEEQRAKSERILADNGFTKSQTKAAIDENRYEAPKVITQDDTIAALTGASEKLAEKGVKDEKLVNAIAAVALQKKAERTDAINRSAPTKLQQRLVEESELAQQIVSQLEAEAVSEENKSTVTWQDKRADIKLNGESVKIVGAEDGKVKIEQNGETKTVESKDLEGLSDGYRRLVDAASTMEGGDAMLEAYRPGQDVKAFARAWNRAYSLYGAQTEMDLQKARQYGSSTLSALTDTQLEKALALGRANAKEQEIAKRDNLTGQVEYWQGGKIDGTDYDAVTEAEARELLGDEEMSLLTDVLTKVVNVTLVKSKQGKNGKYEGAQGIFYRNGHIVLDVNAGMIDAKTGQRTIVLTAAHELTHFIRAYNPAGYKALRTFISGELARKGLSLERLTQQKMDRSSTKMNYDEAMEEVIADSCETMLTDTTTLKRFASENPAEARTIRDWLGKFLDKLNSAFKGLRTAHTEAAAMQDRVEELRRMWFEALAQANQNADATIDKLSEGGQQIVESLGHDAEIQVDKNGDMDLAQSKDGKTIAFSMRTYEDTGKSKLIKALKENGHTQEEIDAVVDTIEATGDFLEKLAQQFSDSHGYNNLKNNLWAEISTNVKTGKQVISTLVNNGDYPVNMDLQLICKKRVAYMRMLTRLIDDGVFEKVDFKGSAIADLNAVLRDGGFETACLGCFVESRRLQLQAWAETIVEEWNSAVDKRNPQAGYFNFASGGNAMSKMEIAGLITELENAGKKNDKGNLNLGKGAVAEKMGRLLDRVPSLAQHLTVADLLTPQGMSTLRSYDQNLFSLVKQRYGAASPKIVQGFNAYNSEIADLSFKFVKDMIGESVKGSGQYTRQAKKSLKQQIGESKAAYNRRVETEAMRKYLYDIGGARIQSFSDFMIENVFDYMQIIADLSAREFPLHGYSKEAIFLRLFGMTGGKFNGSLIAHVEEKMGKEYAGLLPAEEAKDGRGILVNVDGKQYAICFDDYARHVATGSFIQSIGMKDIIALQLDPRYSKNVGSITIGVSDKQILAMLDSPYFRMVIPYHASGMIPEFAKLVGVSSYNDYTDYQTTKVNKCFDLDGNPVDGFWKADGKRVEIDTHYDFNEAVQRLGDAKAAANEYLEWCKQRHPVYDGKKIVGYATFTAKFSDSPYGTDFTTHENYYKLLEDFNSYDSIGGASALQGAVTMTLPSEATRLTAEQMAAYKQALRGTGLFTEKEIEKYSKKADMTFQELIAEEIGNRAEYESQQAKVWDETVDKAEKMLLEKYGRENATENGAKHADRDVSPYTEYQKPITMDDVRSLRTINGGKRLSVNKFTKAELEKTQKWAYRYYQQMGEKSPFFRAWFGDWRASDQTPIQVVNVPKMTKEEIRAYYKTLSGNGVEILDTKRGGAPGWEVSVESGGYKNSEHHAGSDKKSVEGLAAIRELIKNGVLLDTEIHEFHATGKNVDPNNDAGAFNHRFYALGMEEDGSINVYRVNVLDQYRGKAKQNDFLFHNLMQVEVVATNVASGRAFREKNKVVASADGLSGTSMRSAVTVSGNDTTTTFTVADLYRFVKEFDSKFNANPHDNIDPSLLNNDGTPKVLYHQTGADFSIFNTDNPVAGANDSETPNGIFFKDNDHDIGLTGKKQMPVYISAKNLLHFEDRKAANAWYQEHIPGYKALQNEMNRKLAPLNEAFDELDGKFYVNEEISEEEYDTKWNEMIEEMRELENDYRGRLRKLLDDYFLRGESGYDGIELDYDGHRYIDGKREDVHTYIIFKNTQVKSATENIGTFDRSDANIKHSDRDNLGYHAGDLGKAEHLNIQGRSRGTGHFGTGTYFVGVEEKVTKDSHYGKRPQHAVDFSDYNLFKVRNDRDGYRLHDALKIIDGGINKEWIRPALQSEFNIVNPTGYYDLARSKYGEEWASGDNLLNSILEYAKENGIEVKSLEEYKAEEGKGIDDEDLKYYYEDYVKDTVKEKISSINAEYREFMDAVFELRLLPGFTNAKIFSALQAVAEYQDVTPRNARADSYATVFMKNMGYEGVDVRGTGLDNTAYGSVIYDVKPETVAYSLRDTEAVRRQQAKDRARLDALRAEKNAKIDSVRREEIEKRRAAIKKEKAAKWAKVEETEQKYREKLKKQRDDKNESIGQVKYRDQVAEKAARLNKMLLTNSDKLHVPEVLKKPLAEFLSSIDFSSKSMLTKGTETKADVKFQNALTALNDVLARQERYINGEESAEDKLGGYLDISAESMDYLREMTENIHQMMSTGETYTVNAMTAEQLKGLSKLLSNITSAVRNMNNFMANERYATVKEAADADITYMESLGKASALEQSGISDALAWKNGTPYYVLKRFGDGGKAVFDSFARGWEKMAFNAKKIIDFTEQTYTDKEVKEWKKEIHEIELSDGSKIKMTTAQIMAFSQLLGREQAMKHIEKGGIRVGNIEQKVGKVVDTTHYHLTMDDIVKITGALTPRQLAVAKSLQQFMAKQGATWGNEVSMRRFGYNFYDEGDAYYPIRTDSNDRGMQDTEAMQNSMFRLLNLSASKSLNPKASNALIVEDIFDTFADHMADMAKLNGMGLPILDAIKWFNYKERIDLGDGEYDTRTLQGAMEQAFGEQAQRYFRTLMKDINGVTEAGDRGTDLASKFIGNYKAASVAANLRVAFLQPTSYVRAAAIIEPKYLAMAFTNRNAYKEAIANSGTAVWKSLGYYDTNISRGMREQIEHNESAKDKIVEASMTLAELGDKITWGRLWVACKMQAKARNNSLEGQSLINATADLFREVVYATQVMDSTLTRSELMRGKTLYTKAMTAFMAEPTLSYNLLMDWFSTYHLDTRRFDKTEAWRKNGKKLFTAFSTYVASAAFAAVVESVADAVRDDDNDEFWVKFLEALFGEGVTAKIRGEKTTENILKSLLSGNLAQDLTIIGKIPYVKSMISTLQGYKSKDMTSAAFDAIIDSAKIWQESAQLANGTLDKPTKVTYYGNMTEWGKVYKTLQALSQLTGIGASNLTRDVLAIWNATAGEFRPDWKVKTYQSKSERTFLDTVYETGVSWSQYDSALKNMDADENGSVKQEEAGPYLKGEVEAGRMTEEQAQAIWAAIGPTWKKTLAEWLEKNK